MRAAITATHSAAGGSPRPTCCGENFVIRLTDKKSGLVAHPATALAQAIAAALNIPIYHYGNARDPRFLKIKAATGNQYWAKDVFYGTYGDIDPEQIGSFEGSHPAVMEAWLRTDASPGFEFNPQHRLTRRERKHRLLAKLENRFGWDFSKKHFKVIREYE